MDGCLPWLQLGRQILQFLVHLQLLKVKAFIGVAIPLKLVRLELALLMGTLADLIGVIALFSNHGGHPFTLRDDLATVGMASQVASRGMIKNALSAQLCGSA